jgi:IS1 family transposase
MRISLEKALQALNLLVEGCGIRVTSRITGLHQETVLALLEKAGDRARRVLDSKIRNISADQVQADEIWGFVHSKQKNVRPEQTKMGFGDQYTFVAIDPQSKLVLSHVIGRRNSINSDRLMMDLSDRVSGRFQITTDGFRPYLDSVPWTFGDKVDYAQLVKIFEYNEVNRERYSPSKCVGAVPSVIQGNPDRTKICTSHVERNNLTMRTFLRRLTRLSLGFSKKLDNLKHAVALHFAYYNFCRVHRSLKVTPAMKAGITDHVWTLSELILS